MNATRTPFREGRAGIIKIELPDKSTKINLLRNKKKLNDDTRYARVFIRGSQTHTERLLQLNTMTLLKEIGAEDRFRVTGNGRLVATQFTNHGMPQHAGYDHGLPPSSGMPPNGPSAPPYGPLSHPHGQTSGIHRPTNPYPPHYIQRTPYPQPSYNAHNNNFNSFHPQVQPRHTLRQPSPYAHPTGPHQNPQQSQGQGHQ